MGFIFLSRGAVYRGFDAHRDLAKEKKKPLVPRVICWQYWILMQLYN